MIVTFLIAGSLIFYCGYICGAAFHHRRAFDQGHEQAMLEMAEDDAIARSLARREPDDEAAHVVVQRWVSARGMQ